MLECVVNISEGRRLEVIERLAVAAEGWILDLHRDPDHNRSVLTLLGEEAPRRVTDVAVELLDLTVHAGVHPRIGVVDVVPFVPLGSATLADAVAARDRFAAWAATTHGLPCFAYGPERSLPDVRREAFRGLAPSSGPARPHPSAGAVAVGARPVLVAFNVWLDGIDLHRARELARSLRSPSVRALGLQVGRETQVSMNLVDPERVGPAQVWDTIAAEAPVARAELVGLVPETVLRAIPQARWGQLDLAADRTIEARAAAQGIELD